MNQEQKFQQRWEFRGREDDFHSSSNDCRSSSEPALKKHKLVSNLIFPEDDEISNAPIFQQKGQIEPGMAIPVEFGKASKTHTGSRKKNSTIKNKVKKGSAKEGSKKKSKLRIRDSISLDDFIIFTESILEELKVARENMFAQMRETMRKLVAVKSASQPVRKDGCCEQQKSQALHQKVVESGMETQQCNGGYLERLVKRNRTPASNNCYKVIEEQINHDQAIEATASNENDKGERLRLSAKKPINTSIHPDQIVSSPYLTLPTVLSEAQVEKRRVDFSSSNYIQLRVAENNTGTNAERANLMTDASTHRESFSGIQPDEQFESFAQMGSKTLGCFDQHSTQTSTVGIGFPVPLHQVLNNNFNIPSPVHDNSIQDNNIVGLRTNGGAIRFSGGTHILSEPFIANNLRRHMKYKTNGGLMAFGTQDIKGGNLYPS